MCELLEYFLTQSRNDLRNDPETAETLGFYGKTLEKIMGKRYNNE